MLTADFIVIQQIQKVILEQLIFNYISNFTFAFDLFDHPLR